MYGNQVGMKTSQVNLLKNIVKKKDKKNYNTLYICCKKNFRATNVIYSFLTFFSTIFGSKVSQGAFIHALIPFFTIHSLNYINFDRNLFTPSKEVRSNFILDVMYKYTCMGRKYFSFEHSMSCHLNKLFAVLLIITQQSYVSEVYKIKSRGIFMSKIHSTLGKDM